MEDERWKRKVPCKMILPDAFDIFSVCDCDITRNIVNDYNFIFIIIIGFFSLLRSPSFWDIFFYLFITNGLITVSDCSNRLHHFSVYVFSPFKIDCQRIDGENVLPIQSFIRCTQCTSHWRYRWTCREDGENESSLPFLWELSGSIWTILFSFQQWRLQKKIITCKIDGWNTKRKHKRIRLLILYILHKFYMLLFFICGRHIHMTVCIGHT